jgi:hypothetical protein
MLSNEKIKTEELGQERSFRFCNFAIIHTILAENEFSWHPISLKNYTPPRFQLRSTNQTTRAQNEAEGKESNLTRKTAILIPQLW